jgi:hypothetical protein
VTIGEGEVLVRNKGMVAGWCACETKNNSRRVYLRLIEGVDAPGRLFSGRHDFFDEDEVTHCRVMRVAAMLELESSWTDAP